MGVMGRQQGVPCGRDAQGTPGASLLLTFHLLLTVPYIAPLAPSSVV